MSQASPVSAIQSVLNTIIVVQTLTRNVVVEMELVLGNVGKIIITYSNEPFIVKLYCTSTS